MDGGFNDELGTVHASNLDKKEKQRARSRYLNQSSKKGGVIDKIKRFDAFGEPIQMTVNGREKHKTGFGGIMTVVWMVVLLIYSLILFQTSLKEAEELKLTWEVKEFTFSQLTNTDIAPHANSSFIEGIGLAGPDRELDPAFGYFEIEVITPYTFNYENGVVV